MLLKCETVNIHGIYPVNSAFAWQSYNEEPASSSQADSIAAYALWEQVNVTRDSSDYLWYMTE